MLDASPIPPGKTKTVVMSHSEFSLNMAETLERGTRMNSPSKEQLSTSGINYWAVVLVILTCLATGARAASVGPAGYTNAFNTTAPSPGDWSTETVPGDSGDVTIDTALDAAVQLLTASAITTPIPTDAGNPPPYNALATWSSSGQYLQTRPTAVQMAVLMATLVNNTGTNANAIDINYNFTRATTVTEEIRGHRVYYSFSGAAGTWQNIPALNSRPVGRVSATVALSSPWNAGAGIYLLWADDNGSGYPDDANQIDNIFIAAYYTNFPLTVLLTGPSDGQRFATNSAISASVALTGSPSNVSYYVDGSLAVGLGMPPFTPVTLPPQPLGSHTIYATAQDANGAFVVTGTNTFVVSDDLLTFGPWRPLFKGVDYTAGTNEPNAVYVRQQAMYAIRVDLTDPDIQLFAPPRCPNYAGDPGAEALGYTTTNFLRVYGLQVAMNANNFHDPGQFNSPSYTVAEGTMFRISGELVCTGQVVSAQESATDAATLRFTANNQAAFIATNWPAHPLGDAYVSVSGLYTILANGVNVGSNYIANPAFVHQYNPRSLIGLSRDRRYLYLVVVDGRQQGYSDGAVDWESADWLLRLGAWDGANMDGGGSTCLVKQDSTGRPVEINHSSAIPAAGRERTVGGHIGIYAAPLPGFINDVSVLPDDTAAVVTWTTTVPSTTQVQYGPTLAFGFVTPLQTDLVTNHAALLTGLTPNTGYYFQALSSVGEIQFASSNFLFQTTNYATTNFVFDLTNAWTYTVGNLDDIDWAATNYDDSLWPGGGPGLLWVDVRGPNSAIPEPLNTPMPLDPTTGFPYVTYYFRTHFNYTNPVAGASLVMHEFLDDGAVFYLNGGELYRVRMPEAPKPIDHATLASGFSCSGDATCPDDYVILGVTNLLSGDNVLAAEVHNYNAGSPDITFGLAVSAFRPYNPPQPRLDFVSSNAVLTLSWSARTFRLQQATDVGGPWDDVPGPVFLSPYSVPLSNGPPAFFRLIK